MIPIIMISGFLGCGKTTLLNELSLKFAKKRIIYLINEFSAADVDGQVINIREQELVLIPGGSIFCHCKATEFITHLKKITSMKENIPEEIAALVIEASGISNPMVMTRMLRETRLDRHFYKHVNINIIEPDVFIKLIHILPVLKDQVLISDQILLNKISSSDPENIEQTIFEIRKINTKVPIIKTDFCKIDIDPLAVQYSNSYGADKAVHKPLSYFEKYGIKSKRTLNLNILKDIVNEHTPYIYRIKGFAWLDHGRFCHIDYSASGWHTENCSNTTIEAHLEFIFNAKQKETILTMIRNIKQMAFNE